MTLDSQGDFMTPEGIKAASEKFMKSGRTTAIDVNHSGVPVNAFITENMISKGGAFPAGSWVVTAKIEDPDIWKSVRDGKLTGFSMEGNGSRVVSKLNGEDAKQIMNLDVYSISLVGKAANKEKFSVIKSDQMAYLEKHAPELAKLAQRMERIEKGLDANTGLLVEVADPSSTDAAIAAAAAREAVEANRLRREHETISDALFKLQPGTLGYRLSHDRYQARLLDIENELEVLRKGADELRHHDAFIESGGSSAFLQASASDESLTGMNAFGHTTEQQISKDDIPLGHNTMGVHECDEDDVDLNGMVL
jgi:hypothetical protein